MWAPALLARALEVAKTNLQSRVTRLDNAVHHGGSRGQTPDMIVWHCTAGDRLADAWSWLDRVLKSGEMPASYHYGIDKDGSIQRKLPPNLIAWHAGRSTFPGTKPPIRAGLSVNRRSIGIAFANDNGTDSNTRDDELTPAQLESGLWLARVLCGAYKIRSTMNVAHREVAPIRKTDPLFYICPMAEWRTAIGQLTGQ